MDEYEKEYFAKLKKIAGDYDSVRRDLAKSRIKRFVAAVVRQINDEHRVFDLVVVVGNSGRFIFEITKQVYSELGIEIPPVVMLPIFRFKEVDGAMVLNDNSVLFSLIPTNLPNKAMVLFVDDEIYIGLTVKASLELLLSRNPQLESLHCTIIAEHHFFEWHYNLPKVSVNFFSYSRLIQGLNGNIGYFIPDDLFEDLKKHITDVESYNHAMGIVIGGALKRKNKEGSPFYDTSVNDVCIERISNYSERKEILIKELNDLVKDAIKEYKEGIITFRF